MKNLNRWGLAAGFAAALALAGTAHAQSATGSSGGASGSMSGSSDPKEKEPGHSTSATPEKSRGDTGASGSAGAGTSASPSGSTGSGASGSASGSTGSSATGSASGSAGAGGAQKLDKKWQARLEKLHASNQAEIHMGQMGAQTATSPEVKQFAQQMETDHQQLDQELTRSAQSLGAADLQGKDFDKAHKDAMGDMKKLEGKTGSDFDKAFMSQMVKDHERNLKDVRAAAKDAQKSHPELASTLQTAQTRIQGHLDQAKQIQKSLGEGSRAATSSGAASTGTGAGGTQAAPPPSSPGDEPKTKSGGRGDTGGPSPGGADRGTGGQDPTGGAPGSSSDSGTRQQPQTK